MLVLLCVSVLAHCFVWLQHAVLALAMSLPVYGCMCIWTPACEHTCCIAAVLPLYLYMPWVAEALALQRPSSPWAEGIAVTERLPSMIGNMLGSMMSLQGGRGGVRWLCRGQLPG